MSAPIQQPPAGNMALDAGQTGQSRYLAAPEICRAQSAAGTVSYHWHIPSDEIVWSEGAAEVLGCNLETVSTGKRFAGLLDSENVTSRYDTVMRSSTTDAGKGVAFEIEYQFRPGGKPSDKSIWIEDCGCWFADEQGRPRDVYGTMRLADARHVRDQEMNFASNCDPLTGMMNRVKMGDALAESIRMATNGRTHCAFAIVAVNNLKVMNQAYGYEVADEVIVALGQRLRSVMRVGDGIARYSGGKFGLILNECQPNELPVALERFMRAVRDSVIETRHGPVWALLSIGAVNLPESAQDAATAIAHAEEALNESLRLPTDGFVVFSASSIRKEQQLRNARSATEIVKCLRDGLFRLAYQPIYDSFTGTIEFHEALLRMPDQQGNMITAGYLVPIAEELGLIRLIDRAVLQLALSTLETYPDAKLSINVSATTANDARWNGQLIDILASRPELASRLIVEVTETTALGDLDTSHRFVSRLRDCGCGVALDDFGAGFTSYRNLKELPITMIKLDGSFCRGVYDKASDNAIFVKSMVDLAHAFDLKIVAEWVESAEDAEALKAMGVNYLQGHFYGAASINAPWVPRKEGAEPLAQPVPEAVAILAEDLRAEAMASIEEAKRDLDRQPRRRDEDDYFANASKPSAPPAKTWTRPAAEPAAIELTSHDTRNAEPQVSDVAEPVPPAPKTDVDEGLSLLKAALAELSAAVSATTSGEKDNRLAS